MKELVRRVRAKLRYVAKRIWYYGNRRYCPICEHRARLFLPFGLSRRPDVACPFCGSAERHRSVWLVLTERTSLLIGESKQVLHVAPEWCLRQTLSRLPHLEYHTADLLDPSVDYQVDLTHLPFADASWDVIICLNVLQHVSDAGLAFNELYRIIRPNGWIVLTVPIVGERTIEYGADGFAPGQPTHGFPSDNSVRVFGRDFPQILERAGFDVQSVLGRDMLSESELTRQRVDAEALPIYVCRRKCESASTDR